MAADRPVASGSKVGKGNRWNILRSQLRHQGVLLRRPFYRQRSSLRCWIGLHRWRGHEDCGDGVHVAPISGYRSPRSHHAWRVCTWCGAHEISLPRDFDKFMWGGRSNG